MISQSGKIEVRTSLSERKNNKTRSVVCVGILFLACIGLICWFIFFRYVNPTEPLMVSKPTPSDSPKMDDIDQRVKKIETILAEKKSSSDIKSKTPPASP